MKWYRLIPDLHKRLVLGHASIGSGMAEVIRTMASPATTAEAKRLRAIDWTIEEAAFREWIETSLELKPLPELVAGLWFSVPEIDLNTPLIYFIGTRSFDERQSQSDWACDPFWTQEGRRRRKRQHQPEFASQILWEVQRILDTGPGTEGAPEHFDRVAPLLSALPDVYVGLLLRHTLSSIPMERVLGTRDWRGVGYGFASGDLRLAGVMTRNGWAAPVRRFRARYDEPVPRLHEDPKLDLNSDEFDVRAYLKAGLDLNARDRFGQTPLLRACREYDGKRLQRLAIDLLQAGAAAKSASKDGVTPLLLVLDGPQALVEELLKRGANPNARTINEYAPMHGAVDYNGRPETLRLLLQHGGDANLKGLAGSTPLHQIAEYGHPSYMRGRRTRELIHLLVEHGANLEAKDSDGATPLMRAVVTYAEHIHSDSEETRGGHDRVATMLLDAGANPDCRIRHSPYPLVPEGGTPLMCQRYDHGNLHIGLLRAGADPRAKSTEGLTPLDYARRALGSKNVRNKDGIRRVIAALENAMAGKTPRARSGGDRSS